MSLINCFQTALRMGVITADEADELTRRYNEIARETLDTAEARARMQKEIEAEAAHRERAALLTEIARGRILDQLAKYRDAFGKADMLEAWMAMHENFGRIGSFVQDMEGRRMAIANKAQADMRVVMAELARSKLTGDLSRTSKWVGSRKQQARMDNMVRELFGEATGDATAAAMARSWEKVSEDLRVRFNAAGGATAKLERWGMPQSHDPLALMDMGQAAWVRHMMTEGVLDRERTVHPVSRQRLSDADLKTALESIWLKITTDGWSDKDVTAQPKGKGALYTQHADHRFLHFKDADAWLAYAKRFGNPDAFAAMMGHIAVMSRDIAHMEVLGPNPNAMRAYVRSWIEKQAAEKKPVDILIAEAQDRLRDLQAEARLHPSHGDLRAEAERLEQQLQTIAGRDLETMQDDKGATSQTGQWFLSTVKRLAEIRKQIETTPDAPARLTEIIGQIGDTFEAMRQPMTVADGRRRIVDYTRTKLGRADQMWEGMRGVEPHSAHAAEVMQSLRNFISATSLGGAWISSLTDPAFGQDMRQRIGMSFAKANFGRVMVAALREMVTNGSRQGAVDAMLGLDSAMNVLRQKAAEVRGVDHRFWTGWIADRTLTWGLLSPWTQAGKHIVGLDIMRFIGSQTASRFADLPPGLQTALQTHGIGTREWDAIRRTPPVDGLLRPNEIMTTFDRATVDGLNMRDLGERYLQMILRETRYAVPEGTVASRTIMTGAGKPGSIVGEMARSFGQFKGFGVAVLMLHGQRIAREIMAASGRDKFNPIVQAAALAITSTLLGAMAIALKDMKDGRDPRKWLDETTWLDPKHWGAAFLQAGGLGIYGDLLFSETNRFGGGLAQTVAGPLTGRASDVLTIGAELKNAMDSKKTNFAKWGTDLARRDVPFVNHWLTTLVYQRMVMDQLQRMADPEAAAAMARAVQKRRRDYGQDAWWPAGYNAPQRAPDVGRIMATR